MEERFVRNLIKMVKCATCGRRYSPRQASVLGHQDDLWFLSIACTSCQTQGLVAAFIKEQETLPVIMEISERSDQPPNEPVNSDDVLAIHQFLSSFDGDFASLFRIGK